MTAPGWLPAPAEELFGDGATAEESYDVLTVDVPPAAWLTALETARDRLGCTYFDWLSAVDEPGAGFHVSAHVVALSPVRRLLVRTTVPHEAPALPTAVGVYAGAAWHERETHEMFGVRFEDHPALDHLLLPENFEGHPLRKDFVLAARVAKAWPGAKEPGESEHGGPKRRQMLPPGVPDPNDWGPLKGQLPPAPTRPTRAPAARTPGDRPTRTAGDRPVRAAGERAAAAGERPVRAAGEQAAAAGDRPVRAAGERPVRAAGERSAASAERPVRAAGEHPAGPADAPSAQAAGEPPAQPAAAERPARPTGERPARRMRTAAEGSASQTPSQPPPTTPETATPADTPPTAPTTPSTPRSPTGPRRSRSASGGSASQRAEDPTTPGTSPEQNDAAGSAEAAEPAAPQPQVQPPAPTRGPRRARSASQGSASQREATPDAAAPDAAAPDAAAPDAVGETARPARAPRSSDAPWHHARPAFDDSEPRSKRTEPDRPEPERPPSPADDTPADTEADPATDEEGTPDRPDTPRGGPQ
ncbi:NADH-quinone oxidoreductase subunit C [Streptomyces sp. NPDC002328]|uniref:NADH-quinone oxidoreductase subunit C n=1 Tax=Streptomyces sp. NPDC002328 TaxID=3364642 RepID=UPI0036AA682A